MLSAIMALRRLLRFGNKSPKNKMSEADSTVSKAVNEASEGVAKMTVDANASYEVATFALS